MCGAESGISGDGDRWDEFAVRNAYLISISELDLNQDSDRISGPDCESFEGCMAPSTIRISDQWYGMKATPPQHREQLQSFLDGLDFEWLQRRATPFVGTNCELRKDLFDIGREHIVFEILSPTSAAIVRIRKPTLATSESQNLQSEPTAQDMSDEITTLNYVSENTTIPVPRIYDYDTSSDNPLGAPYMLMEEMPGHHVHHLRIPQSQVRTVYAQVSDIVLQLSKLTFPRIGLMSQQECVFEDYHRVDAFHSPKEFYLARAQRFYEQQMQQCDVNWKTLAWLYLEAIPLICNPRLDNGPFPLRHPDLNNLNILFDDEFNVVGVIDWTLTQAVPWQTFVVPPNQFDALCYSENRQVYLDVFEEVERLQNPEIPITKLMRDCEIMDLLESYHGWGAFVEWRALALACLVFGREVTWVDVVQKYRASVQNGAI